MKKIIILFVVLCVGSAFMQPIENTIDPDSLEVLEELGIGQEPTADDVADEFSDEIFALSDVSEFDGRQTGQYIFPSGCPNEVVHEGPFAYVANSSTIEIFNISNPQKPVLLLSAATYNANGIDVQNGYVFVASTSHGLITYRYDYETNELIRLSIYRHDPNIEYRFVDIVGNHAFVSCKTGIELIDVTNPSSPAHEIFVSCGKLNKDLIVQGYRAFIAGAYYGIYIVDYMGYFTSGGAIKTYTLTYNPTHGEMNCIDIALNGDFLYCADNNNGLEIFNWRKFIDKETFWVGECYRALQGKPTGVGVSGSWAFLTTNLDPSTGYLYVINVKTPNFRMTPYASYSNSYGAVSPDPCSHLTLFVSGRSYPLAAFFIERTALSLMDLTFATWVSHTEISSTGMFGGWIVVEWPYAYVCGRGYTLTKYDLSGDSPVEVAHTAAIDQGYSAAIFGEDIFVAGKRGLWRFKKTTLSPKDSNNTVHIYGEVKIYNDPDYTYAIVMGLNTPDAGGDSIRRIIAAYDISSASNIVFKDTMFLDHHGAGEPCDPAYMNNWYYFGLIDGIQFISGGGSGSDLLYTHSVISTRAREWWSANTPVPFIPHSGRMAYQSICYRLSDNVFTFYGEAGPIGSWSAGKSAFGHNLPKFDVNWNSTERKDFVSLYLTWPSANWYLYGTYGTSPNYNSIRTHFMEVDFPNYYWAVWDEQGIANSNRFPLWYCHDEFPGLSSSFTRINTPIGGDPSWGSFSELIPISFSMNGSSQIILITKKTGELYYYIDVLQVLHTLSSSFLAKVGSAVNRGFNIPINITVSPNPFNTYCEIEFSGFNYGAIKLEIFNINGEKVFTENINIINRKKYNYVWNGTNKNDLPLSTGLYLIKITGINEVTLKRVLLLK